jgi:hypothetical protein
MSDPRVREFPYGGFDRARSCGLIAVLDERTICFGQHTV